MLSRLLKSLRNIVVPVLAMALMPPAALAINPVDRHAVINGTEFFELGTAQCASGNLTGDNNRQIAFNFFASKLQADGAANAAELAAGIVGNLQRESGLDPKIVNSIGATGIAQWLGGRKTNMLAFGPAIGQDPLALDAQLAFLWYELTGELPDGASGAPGGGGAERAAYDAFRGVAGIGEAAVEQATIVFEDKFERSEDTAGSSGMNQRIAFAKEIYLAYGGNISGVTASASNCGGAVNTDGYSFPLEVTGDKRQITSNSKLPCNITNCHHDDTAAFDLNYGAGNATLGKKVFAIHDGVIENLRNQAGNACVSMQLRQTNSKNSEDDGWYYWHGHMANATVSEGQEVKAGQQIAEVGDQTCADSSQTHLHIDRGAVKGQPVRGKSAADRDPGFIDLINSLYEQLP